MTQSLDLIFCGTPLFAVPTLEALAAAGHRIHLVVTQPDRPKGRGLELVASPVRQSALKLNLPITQPDRIKTNDEFCAQLTAINPDAIIVAALDHEWPRGDKCRHLGIVERGPEIEFRHFVLTAEHVAGRKIN